jgi:hypothetical protein
VARVVVDFQVSNLCDIMTHSCALIFAVSAASNPRPEMIWARQATLPTLGWQRNCQSGTDRQRWNE